MAVLVLGLVLFLGVHSVRIFADDWRTGRVAAWGENGFKGAYSLVSLVGFGLLIWGYGLATASGSPDLYAPLITWRHLTWLLVLIAFVLLAATYVPGSHIKAHVRHPMVVGVAMWSGGHLLVNGRLADVLLFGGFFVWSVASFLAARGRDRRAGVARPKGYWSRDLIVVVVGLVAWFLFARYAHAWLFGVPAIY